MLTSPRPDRGRRAVLWGWLNDPDDPWWQRPAPTERQQRNDLFGALLTSFGAVVLSVLAWPFVPQDDGLLELLIVSAAMPLPLAIRRRFPLTVLLVSTVLFVGLRQVSMVAAGHLVFQATFFGALYTAVAWGRDRRRTWGAAGAVLVMIMGWMALLLAVDGMPGAEAAVVDPDWPWLHVLAAVLYDTLTVLIFFGAAIVIGRTAWRGALREHRLKLQARRIEAQSEELARGAVTEERMRIARDLHDSVAHHVAVIGVQAGAGRRVLERNPEAAAEALRAIEAAGRSAVTEMRTMLGVLREDDRGGAGLSRGPAPGSDHIEVLASSFRDASLDVAVDIDLACPDAGVVRQDAAAMPAQVSRTAYRIVQESLANVSRHSTATHARVVLRRCESDEEDVHVLRIEVTDDGRAKRPVSGEGYGIRGMKERAATFGGIVEAGPLSGGPGWRVLARIPIPAIQGGEAR